MLVSAIIPVFNGARFLGEAIESVLGQSYRPIEVIVVNDGSTDQSAVIAKSFNDVKVMSISHSGVAAARNAGVAASSGPLVTFLDADDLWMPRKLAEQASYLRLNPDVDGVFGLMMNFLEPGNPLPAWLKPGQLDCEMAGHSLCTVLLHRRALDEVGGFNSEMACGEDGDWFFRARDAGLRFDTVDTLVLRRRIHDANLSHDASAMRSGIVHAVRQSLKRKRETT